MDGFFVSRTDDKIQWIMYEQIFFVFRYDILCSICGMCVQPSQHVLRVHSMQIERLPRGNMIEFMLGHIIPASFSLRQCIYLQVDRCRLVHHFFQFRELFDIFFFSLASLFSGT